MVAPAMDEDMWHHPSTQANLEKLRSFDNIVIPVNNGELASGLSGEGRMAEPEEIITLLSRFFEAKKSLAGKKILVSAGPTHEALDPVRFLGNASTGKMGIAIAGELQARGAEVDLVLGPTTEKVNAGIKVTRVNSAQEMYEACLEKFASSDWAIMSAAVADYTPSSRADKKIKKDGEVLHLELVKTPDILKTLGEMKQVHQCLVGFALETDNERENAIKKMHAKNADLIVLNSLNDAGAGFGHDTNKISIFDRSGGEINFEMKSKTAVAADIVNTIINFTHE
jgi:phosphopantothenoylcysteine decarboxylase/phosphopantothenate--cysteine ligase